MEEHKIYEKAHPDDRWIFNKLEIALRIGSKAGMKETPIPAEGWYIIRPIINLHGMGIDAHFRYMYFDTDIPSGMFWCEIYKGRHISVDYFEGKPVLCVEGEYDVLNIWKRWRRLSINEAPEFPDIFRDTLRRQSYHNIEFIGGQPIEAHFRHNPDFKDRPYGELFPVWKDTSLNTMHWLIGLGYEFIEDYEKTGYNERIGFFAK